MAEYSSDEYSYDPEDPNKDVTVVLHLREHNYDEVHEVLPRPQRKQTPTQMIEAKFRPTAPVFHPSLHFSQAKIEAKLNEPSDKPEPKWKQFPSLLTDYFNYGFTDIVWEAYKYKQEALRRLYRPEGTEKRHRRKKIEKKD